MPLTPFCILVKNAANNGNAAVRVPQRAGRSLPWSPTSHSERAAACPGPQPLTPPPPLPHSLCLTPSQVAMFVIALLMSLISAIFIILRVRRINQNIASSGNGHSAPKGCHTRAAASVTLSVLSFVLMLVAAIS